MMRAPILATIVIVLLTPSSKAEGTFTSQKNSASSGNINIGGNHVKQISEAVSLGSNETPGTSKEGKVTSTNININGSSVDQVSKVILDQNVKLDNKSDAKLDPNTPSIKQKDEVTNINLNKDGNNVFQGGLSFLKDSTNLVDSHIAGDNTPVIDQKNKVTNMNVNKNGDHVFQLGGAIEYDNLDVTHSLLGGASGKKTPRDTPIKQSDSTMNFNINDHGDFVKQTGISLSKNDFNILSSDHTGGLQANKDTNYNFNDAVHVDQGSMNIQNNIFDPDNKQKQGRKMK